MKHKFFLSLLLALVPLCLLAQVPVTRNSTKPKAKPKTEQTAKPVLAKKKTNEPAKPSAAKRTNSSGATSSAANAKLILNNLTANMVYVSGGTFTMGATSEQGSDYDSDEIPVHSVTLSSFYICKYEVTQALWNAVMGSNPSNWKGDDLPVETVSRDDCQTFIRKLNALTGKNFRLPTEAQWEYAARGGNKSKGYTYSGSNAIDDVAWYYDNSGGMTHPVKTKAPNELGIYDMSGNVSEWCSDWYGDYSSAAQTDPTGPATGSGRVGRGGSWRHDATGCRVATHSSCTPASASRDTGLRLAY